MNENSITLQSRFMAISGPEIDELENLCRQNGICFYNVVYRVDGPQNSVLSSLATFFFSRDVVHNIAIGIISSAVWDGIKKVFAKIFHLERSNKSTDESKRGVVSEITLKSASAVLEIVSDQVTEESISKAMDTFVKVSEATHCEDHPVIPTYVVINGENVVTVMTQNDFILKYVVPKKSTEEAGNNGQA